MDDKLNNHTPIDVIDDLTERAIEATRSFWRQDKKCFWRDSKEVKSAKPHDYYPTATFICAASLHEASSLPVGDEDGTNFSWKSFLEGVKGQGGLGGIIGQSDVMAIEDEPKWNIYTAAWGVKALAAAYGAITAKGRVTGLSEDRKSEYIALIKENASTHTVKIAEHLKRYKGGVLRDGMRAHPFLTFCAVDALLKAGQMKGVTCRNVDPETRKSLCDEAVRESHRIISLSVLDSMTPSDLIALIYHGLLLSTYCMADEAQLVSYSVDLVAKWQSKTGGWPLGRALSYSPGGQGLQISSFDVGASLVEVACRLAAHSSTLAESAERRYSAFASLFHAIEHSVLNVTLQDGRTLKGWCNENVYGHDVVEGWTTAIVLRFLKGFRSYAQMRLQEKCLKKYDTKWPDEMSGWVKWEKLEEPDSKQRILRFMTSVNYNFLSTTIISSLQLS